ncbi:MAG: hypothetical protein ACKVWR_17315 [Acidimicrobiales bacterium]
MSVDGDVPDPKAEAAVADPDPLGSLEEPACDSERLVRRVMDIISSARTFPMSSSPMVNRDELIDLLQEAVDRIPAELREARWLLKQREEHLAQAKRDGEDILEAARLRAERMVQRTEVVRAAELRARKIVEAADADARRLRLEAEDFCDQKLGSFEIVLERTLKLVGAGREKLSGARLAAQLVETAEPPALNGNGGLFDQDQA